MTGEVDGLDGAHPVMLAVFERLFDRAGMMLKVPGSIRRTTRPRGRAGGGDMPETSAGFAV